MTVYKFRTPLGLYERDFDPHIAVDEVYKCVGDYCGKEVVAFFIGWPPSRYEGENAGGLPPAPAVINVHFKDVTDDQQEDEEIPLSPASLEVANSIYHQIRQEMIRAQITQEVFARAAVGRTQGWLSQILKYEHTDVSTAGLKKNQEAIRAFLKWPAKERDALYREIQTLLKSPKPRADGMPNDDIFQMPLDQLQVPQRLTSTPTDNSNDLDMVPISTKPTGDADRNPFNFQVTKNDNSQTNRLSIYQLIRLEMRRANITQEVFARTTVGKSQGWLSQILKYQDTKSLTPGLRKNLEVITDFLRKPAEERDALYKIVQATPMVYRNNGGDYGWPTTFPMNSMLQGSDIDFPSSTTLKALTFPGNMSPQESSPSALGHKSNDENEGTDFHSIGSRLLSTNSTEKPQSSPKDDNNREKVSPVNHTKEYPEQSSSMTEDTHRKPPIRFVDQMLERIQQDMFRTINNNVTCSETIPNNSQLIRKVTPLILPASPWDLQRGRDAFDINSRKLESISLDNIPASIFQLVRMEMKRAQVTQEVFARVAAGKSQGWLSQVLKHETTPHCTPGLQKNLQEIFAFLQQPQHERDMLYQQAAAVASFDKYSKEDSPTMFPSLSMPINCDNPIDKSHSESGYQEPPNSPVSTPFQIKQEPLDDSLSINEQLRNELRRAQITEEEFVKVALGNTQVSFTKMLQNDDDGSQCEEYTQIMEDIAQFLQKPQSERDTLYELVKKGSANRDLLLQNSNNQLMRGENLRSWDVGSSCKRPPDWNYPVTNCAEDNKNAQSESMEHRNQEWFNQLMRNHTSSSGTGMRNNLMAIQAFLQQRAESGRDSTFFKGRSPEVNHKDSSLYSSDLFQRSSLAYRSSSFYHSFSDFGSNGRSAMPFGFHNNHNGNSSHSTIYNRIRQEIKRARINQDIFAKTTVGKTQGWLSQILKYENTCALTPGLKKNLQEIEVFLDKPESERDTIYKMTQMTHMNTTTNPIRRRLPMFPMDSSYDGPLEKIRITSDINGAELSPNRSDSKNSAEQEINSNEDNEDINENEMHTNSAQFSMNGNNL